MKKITIGSRGSKLSIAYAMKVKNLLVKENEQIEEKNIDLKLIKTSGDMNQNVKLSEIGGKNLFCKEIEESLLSKEIDIAVHSLKDMDSVENPNLLIGALIKRNDPRDVIISKTINNLEGLKKKVKIGSSSRRRELQLKRINENISIINIRGNIDTRIDKLNKNELDGLILAAAGVKSLNLKNKISFCFDIDQILPALGQGVIAVQCRKENLYIKDLIKKINDSETSICAKAERQLLKTLGGNCETAIGGIAEIKDKNLILKAQLFSDNGKESFEYKFSGQVNDAIKIGKIVGEKLLNLAGDKFKKK